MSIHHHKQTFCLVLVDLHPVDTMERRSSDDAGLSESLLKIKMKESRTTYQ